MKKMQVFISSTYKDLIGERLIAVQTILQCGHIPTGMEFFGQDNREQWEVIKQWIDESDIFLIMIKNRYGSICPNTGISYTQMEFEYAMQQGKPIIKLVLNDAVDESECDNITALSKFRALVRQGGTDATIHTEAEFAQRITAMLHRYNEEISTGLYSYDEIRKIKEKQDMIHFLMFAEDVGSAGFNRFSVAPKIMMLLDKKARVNKVDIGQLDIQYTIKASERTDEKTYDCERCWRLSNVRNASKADLKKYYFYTATDIGERNNANVQLTQCIQEKAINLDEVVKNNGISCWSWAVEPNLRYGQRLDNMQITESVKDAWYYKRPWDIAYFIPKCFGERIDYVNFRFETDSSVPILDMNLYEIKIENGRVVREFVQGLARRNCGDGRHLYGIGVDGIRINMENFYYIKITKVE